MGISDAHRSVAQSREAIATSRYQMRLA